MVMTVDLFDVVSLVLLIIGGAAWLTLYAVERMNHDEKNKDD